jgi:hypothetical protein
MPISKSVQLAKTKDTNRCPFCFGRGGEFSAHDLRDEPDPGTTAVSGFFRAFFQGGIQKISFPTNDLWGGLELKYIANAL